MLQNHYLQVTFYTGPPVPCAFDYRNSWHQKPLAIDNHWAPATLSPRKLVLSVHANLQRIGSFCATKTAVGAEDTLAKASGVNF